MADVSVLLQEQPTQVLTDYSPQLLYLGIKSSIGTAVSGELQYNILNKDQAAELFGRTSHIYQGLQTAFDIIKDKVFGDDNVVINAIGFTENVAGVKSTSSITVTGTATDDAVIKVIVASAKYYTFNVEISSGDLQSAIAQKIVDEINANISVPVVATINGTNNNVIDLETTFKSNIANNYHLEVIGSIPGSTIAITAFSGGTTTPDISSIKTLLLDKKFNGIIIDKQFLDADASILEFFTEEARINKVNDDVAGMLMTTMVDTYSNIHAEMPDYKNTKAFTLNAIASENNTLSKGNYAKEMPFAISSEIMARTFLTVVPESNITDFTGITGRGNPSWYAVSLNETVMLNLSKRADKKNGFSVDENKQLKKDGALIADINKTTLNWEIDNNATTYTQKISGDPAEITQFSQWNSYFFVRTYIRNILLSSLRKTVMTSGNTVAGTRQINQSDFVGMIMSGVRELATSDANGVVLGLIRNDEEKLQDLQSQIERTVKFVFRTGTITAEMTPAMVQALNLVILTIIQSNN